MSRHVFSREQCQAGGRTRAAQASAQVAREKGGKQRAAQPAFRDHQVARGRKGYATTLERYGLAAVLDKVAAYWRAHLTAPESWVRLELLDQGLRENEDFWLQVRCRLAGHEAILDCVVETAACTRLVIEPGAARWHDPAADAARDAALQDLGYQVLRLDADLIRRRPAAARAQLLVALGAARAQEQEAA